jgi:hypothetical protein
MSELIIREVKLRAPRAKHTWDSQFSDPSDLIVFHSNLPTPLWRLLFLGTRVELVGVVVGFVHELFVFPIELLAVCPNFGMTVHAYYERARLNIYSERWTIEGHQLTHGSGHWVVGVRGWRRLGHLW